VQSLLLESGPTLAAAFLEADLVDKLMLFVAPTISGEGPGLFAWPPAVLTHQTARRVGDDVLLTAYFHEP
jgi:diaminohydroxyphosphoribosylaminopyrimidine deaminase/5-amino-6-(5-phosphoribosylamino)uracil reductase